MISWLQKLFNKHREKPLPVVPPVSEVPKAEVAVPVTAPIKPEITPVEMPPQPTPPVEVPPQPEARPVVVEEAIYFKAPKLPKLPVAVPNRDFTLLHPVLRERVEAALEECRGIGLYAHVFEGYRSFDRSEYLWEQGRTKPGKIITNARGGQSFHNYGLAVDVVFDGEARDGIQWSWEGSYGNPQLLVDKKKHWSKLGEIFEGKGLEWAARWKRFPETPHFQLTAGLSLKLVQSLHARGGLQGVWDEVSRKMSLKI